MSEQRQWNLLKLVLNILDSLQRPGISSTLFECRSLYKKYRNSSLAILNKFSCLRQAISMAQEYEIPLLDMIVCTGEQEQFVVRNILHCFQNSQILNQGFVLWGRFCSNMHGDGEPDGQGEGVLRFYHNATVYRQIRIKDLPDSEEQIHQLFNQCRTQYYELADETVIDSKQAQKQKPQKLEKQPEIPPIAKIQQLQNPKSSQSQLQFQQQQSINRNPQKQQRSRSLDVKELQNERMKEKKVRSISK